MSFRDKLLRPAQVARMLGIHRSTVYRWFWEDRLPGVKLGESNQAPVRIYASAVQERLNYFADHQPEYDSGTAILMLLAHARMMVGRG
jgi:excisionase family DNA binding protein